MEGIGAAWTVILHRAELRDALISEQPSDRVRVGLAGSGLRARGIGLAHLIAGWISWLRATHAGAEVASVSAHLIRSE
jgi:hypothetical protein